MSETPLTDAAYQDCLRMFPQLEGIGQFVDVHIAADLERKLKQSERKAKILDAALACNFISIERLSLFEQQWLAVKEISELEAAIESSAISQEEKK